MKSGTFFTIESTLWTLLINGLKLLKNYRTKNYYKFKLKMQRTPYKYYYVLSAYVLVVENC